MTTKATCLESKHVEMETGLPDYQVRNIIFVPGDYYETLEAHF